MAHSPLDTVLEHTHLLQAWDKVRRNRGCSGTDGQTIASFGANLQANLWSLIQEIRLGAYLARPLRAVDIDRPGKSPRMLAIPSVRDRILQTAVALYLEPLLESEFEQSSFGYRPGRSVDLAVRRIMQHRQAGYHWVVDADISRYFDEIDQTLLMQRLDTITPLGQLGALIRHWLRTPILAEQGAWIPIRGIPQGSPLSPLLANLYLDKFDERLSKEDIKLVRYADDFLILCKSQQQAEEALELTDELLDALTLELNEDKTQITHFDEGFRFLGVHFLRSLVMKSPQPKHSPRKTANNTEQQAALSQAIANPPPTFDLDDTPSFEDEEAEVPTHTAPIPRHSQLRTLYVMEQSAKLSLDGGSLCIRQQGELSRRIPIQRLDQIVLLGNIEITTPLMNACLKRDIPIALLSRGGQFRGIIDDFDNRNTRLQRRQFQCIDSPPIRLTIARAFVRAKLINSRTLLNRYARSRQLQPLRHSAGHIQKLLKEVDQSTSLDALRGYEGMGANYYFSAWRETLDSKWQFNGRQRRPAPCPVNALLSFGYTLLFNNAFSLIRLTGLNTHAAFLHSERSGHPALASDVIEEFRALTVDAVVLNLIFNERLTPDDFEQHEQGCRINAQARKIFIKAFEDKLNSQLKRANGEARFSYRQCMDQQLQKLATTIRDSTQPYTPFLVR